MKEKLEKLATIKSGYQFRGGVDADPNGNVKVIQVRDLVDDQLVSADNLNRVLFDKVPSSSTVSDGDVIFLSRGHRLFASAITIPLENVIVPGYFFIVKPDQEKVTPEYLAWYISQPTAQNALKQFHAGTHMPIVPMSAFRALEIEVPPIETQKAIVAIDQLSRREQQLVRQLADARHQLMQELCRRAINRTSDTGTKI